MTAVQVAGATVTFGPLCALDGVDLEVPHGEVLAVLGPSGSGKSTLLRAIAGLQPLAAGSVLLGGEPMDGIPAHRRGVGMMFQHHALFPHRDVAGNVGFGLLRQGHRGPEVQHRVDRMLELVGLAGFGPRSVSQLSGGEQQRVALARALAPSPKVLLLDEPMGALDRELRERLLQEVGALVRGLGLTVVAVTHDQAEAFTLADRILLLEGGRVRQIGTPEDVWSSPADAGVARLLGLGTLVAVSVRSGMAVGPWGPVAVEGPDGPAMLVVRPSAVLVEAGAPVEAQVAATTFRGATTQLDLVVADGPDLRAEVPTRTAPRRGAAVRVRLDPEGVVRLPA